VFLQQSKTAVDRSDGYRVGCAERVGKTEFFARSMFDDVSVQHCCVRAKLKTHW
jgi:hypothetical protein